MQQHRRCGLKWLAGTRPPVEGWHAVSEKPARRENHTRGLGCWDCHPLKWNVCVVCQEVGWVWKREKDPSCKVCKNCYYVRYNEDDPGFYQCTASVCLGLRQETMERLQAAGPPGLMVRRPPPQPAWATQEPPPPPPPGGPPPQQLRIGNQQLEDSHRPLGTALWQVERAQIQQGQGREADGGTHQPSRGQWGLVPEPAQYTYDPWSEGPAQAPSTAPSTAPAHHLPRAERETAPAWPVYAPGIAPPTGLIQGLAAPDNEVPIYIDIADGLTVLMGIDAAAMTDDLKAHIYKEEGIEPCQQLLTFEGVRLEDGRTIAEYGIRKMSTLQLATLTVKNRVAGNAGGGDGAPSDGWRMPR